MPFTFQKVLDHGTTHPIVARLGPQARDLLQLADLSEEQRQDVFGIHFEMTKRLLKCYDIQERLDRNLEKSISETKPTTDPRIRNLPYVQGLEGDAESFLYEAKNYLRSLLGIFKVFFAMEFDEASAFYDPRGRGPSKLSTWAAKRFGPEDALTVMLCRDQSWVGEIIRLRNAVEHPGGKSGTLHIGNVGFDAAGNILPPSWHRNDQPPQPIIHHLESMIDRLLRLAEDILVLSVQRQAIVGPIRFVEIPVEQRNPQCPVRIRAELDPNNLRPVSHPSNG